jgi:hypothetical protein
MSLFLGMTHLGVPSASYIPVSVYSSDARPNSSLPTGDPLTSAARAFPWYPSGILACVSGLFCVERVAVATVSSSRAFRSLKSVNSLRKPVNSSNIDLLTPVTSLESVDLLSIGLVVLAFVDPLVIAGISIVICGVLLMYPLPDRLCAVSRRVLVFSSLSLGLITYKTVLQVRFLQEEDEGEMLGSIRQVRDE